MLLFVLLLEVTVVLGVMLRGGVGGFAMEGVLEGADFIGRGHREEGGHGCLNFGT